jgi:predicted exporter
MQQTIQGDLWWLSLWATLLVMTFLFASYGSFSVLALSLVPITSAIVAGIVVVDLAFGFIHGITLAFGVTLLGVVDDYPIHLFSHLTRESRATAVMREIWPTMRLGGVATAIGFSALLLSGFPGLSQLGLFAIVGLFTAACVTRWVLPHIVPAGFQARRDGLQLARWADALTKARVAVLVLVVLAVGSFVWSDAPWWERDIANLPGPDREAGAGSSPRDELGRRTSGIHRGGGLKRRRGPPTE